MNIINIVKWILVVVLLSCFFWIAIMNGTIFWQSHIKKEQTSSWIPLIGGLFGLCALIIMPVENVIYWCWLPLLLDWGCLPGITETIIWFIKDMKKK